MGGFTDHVSAREPVDDDDDVDVAPAARPFERTTPTLAHVVPLALAAQQRGEAFVDVEMSGYGRAWAPRVAIVSDKAKHLGLWGHVVARMREAPSGADKPIDSGSISRLLVRYSVMEILDLHRREQVWRQAPRATLAINQRRVRPKNVMIR